MITPMHALFEYTNFREYLRDYFAWHKKHVKGYSYRKMASQVGFSSSNYLMLVMNGKRNLGQESLRKVCNALGFKKKEAEYFSYLVFFQQAKTVVEKNYYFGLISTIRSEKTISDTSPEQLDFYATWYHPVIRELIRDYPETIDFKKLARDVKPSITVPQARKSVELLKKLGLIYIDENKTWQQTSPLINTGDALNSFAVRKYHTKILDIASETLLHTTPEEREYSAVTARISSRGFEKLKERVQNFRKELLQIIQDDQETDRVIQINMQVFPVSQNSEKENKSDAI